METIYKNIFIVLVIILKNTFLQNIHINKQDPREKRDLLY